METRISRRLLDRLLARAAASPGLEICGLLFGAADRIDDAPAAANVAADPSAAFEIDPAVLIAAHRNGRGGGPQIVGCYHSHPSGGPDPSPRDAAAAEPGTLWLILGDGGARLWRSHDGGFDRVALVVA